MSDRLKLIVSWFTSILVLIIVISAIIFVTRKVDDVHDAKQAFVTDRFQFVERNRSGLYNESIIYDTETGVQYLIVQVGNAAGVTPLLDENGNATFYSSEN